MALNGWRIIKPSMSVTTVDNHSKQPVRTKPYLLVAPGNHN